MKVVIRNVYTGREQMIEADSELDVEIYMSERDYDPDCFEITYEE